MKAPIVQALGDWAAGGGRLHARLAAALRGAVARGELPPGTRLPAERALARMLAVSRGTVGAAYGALVREGILEGRRGSGTYVRRTPERTPAARGLELVRLPRTMRLSVGGEAGTIDLASATSSWLDLLSPDVVSAALADPGLQGSHGYELLGLPSYRRAVAAQLSAAGLATSEDAIVATSGAQQAIVLVAGLFVRRGDRVAIEDPTYTGAIDALQGAGAALRPVPVDGRGVRVDVLRDLAEREPLRLAYLVTTFHNPTGALLAPERRRELVQLSAAFDLPLVDDLVMAGLWLEQPAPPPLAALDPNAPVLTIGSLSKLFWGGLRAGWIRAPADLVPALAQLKAIADLGSSLVGQALAARLLERADAVAAQRRAQLAANVALVEEVVAELLPGWSWQRPAGGATLWMRLPYGDAEELAQVGSRHGVLLLPGSVASPESAHRDRLRLPLLREPAELEQGLRRLATAWAAYRPRLGERRPATLRVTV